MSLAQDNQLSELAIAEATLIDWWHLHAVEVICEFGEWYIEIDERRFSITSQALAVIQGIAMGRS